MILVVEDEASIAEVVTLYLRRAGFEATAVNVGADAVRALDESPPELVVLDLTLPDMEGLDILRRLRGSPEPGAQDTPVIVLTARGGEADRIAGLEMGADDYVVKPFSPQELVSRVRAVLRRAGNGPSGRQEQQIVANGLRIDPRTRIVEVDGDERALTAREFDLLWTLARNPRQVFNRDQLLDLVWGYTDFIDPGTVTVHVRRLREKIERDPGAPRHIVTVWGVGYRFEP